jgi:hypothetical protein
MFSVSALLTEQSVSCPSPAQTTYLLRALLQTPFEIGGNLDDDGRRQSGNGRQRGSGSGCAFMLSPVAEVLLEAELIGVKTSVEPARETDAGGRKSDTTGCGSI